MEPGKQNTFSTAITSLGIGCPFQPAESATAVWDADPTTPTDATIPTDNAATRPDRTLPPSPLTRPPQRLSTLLPRSTMYPSSRPSIPEWPDRWWPFTTPQGVLAIT